MEPPHVEVRADELAGGPTRGPWRPSRGHWAIAGALLAVLAVIAGSSVAAARAQHARELDRAALAGIFVSVVPAPETAPVHAAAANMAVRNEGVLPVRVSDLRVELPGYASSRLGVVLRGGEAVTVPVPDALPCRLALRPPEIIKVRLDLVTGRGQHVSREAFAQNGALSQLYGLAERRCGYLRPWFAFVATADSGRTLGDVAVFTLLMGNDSVLPLRVTGLRSAPGLAFTFSHQLPLALPAKKRPTAAPTLLATTLRLRVTNCASLLRFLGDDPRNVDSSLLIAAQLVSPLGSVGGPLFLGPPDELEGPVAQLYAPVRHLLSCSRG